MCRIFALRANRGTRACGSLLTASHSLLQQSRSDRLRQSHDNGWGIGYYADGQVQRMRSVRPAYNDPEFSRVADQSVGCALLAHVRQASVGPISLHNTHPFVHGRWLFAHNGTLVGFATGAEKVRCLIPGLQQYIEGDTDSEHAFYLLLSLLEKEAGTLSGPVPVSMLTRALVATIGILERLFPGTGDEHSAFNFAIMDSQVMAVARWGRSLWWLERHDQATLADDPPVGNRAGYRAVAVASEPTTSETWTEMPERTVLQVDAELASTVVRI